MKVRMLTTAAGPDGVYRAGELWDAPAKEASALIAVGAAVAVEPLPAPVPDEQQAVLTPANVEYAVARKRRKQ
jgi:hypothetical protein